MPPIPNTLHPVSGINVNLARQEWAHRQAARQQDGMMGIGVPDGLPRANLANLASTYYVQGLSSTQIPYWIQTALDFLKQLASLTPLAKGATN